MSVYSHPQSSAYGQPYTIPMQNYSQAPPPHPAYPYPPQPVYHVDPNMFRRDYMARLSELTVNSRPIIQSLSVLAQEFSRFAEVVVQCIEAHIRRVSDSLFLCMILRIKRAYIRVPLYCTTNKNMYRRVVPSAARAKTRLSRIMGLGAAAVVKKSAAQSTSSPENAAQLLQRILPLRDLLVSVFLACVGCDELLTHVLAISGRLR